MLRKLICITAVLLMLSCSLSGAFAFEKLETPVNLRWDGMIARWDSVPNAASYTILLKANDPYTYFQLSSSEPYVDCTYGIRMLSEDYSDLEGTLYYTFSVKANPSDYSIYTSSDTSTDSQQYVYEIPPRKKLETPTNLRWEETTARWDAVPNATKYSIIIEVSGTATCFQMSSTEPHVDCAEGIKSLSEDLPSGETMLCTFSVKAQANETDYYVSSELSAKSPIYVYEIPSREKLATPTNLRWNSTTLNWDSVPNADRYTLFLYMKTNNYPVSWHLSTSDTSIECIKEMQQMAADARISGEILEFYIEIFARTDDYDHYIKSDIAVSPSIYINPIAKDELPGDIDIDGVPGVSDARIVLQAIAKGNVSEAVRQVADVDNNGKLDANDALKIMQYSAGWNVTLK